MIVSIDATPLTVPTGGVARYTSELSCALAEAFPGDSFWLISDQPFAMPRVHAANLRPGAGPQTFSERRWWLWGIRGEMARLNAEIFHGTDFSVPYLPKKPSVMTLHDLSPWLDPGWHSAGDRVRVRTPVLLRLGLATMVVTPTEAIRKEAIARFRLQPERIVAIPLAAGLQFQPSPGPAPRTPYYLYTGTLEPRKNLALIVRAWREIRKTRNVDLVLAGRRRSDFDAFPPEPGLQLPGIVPEADLPALYSGAAACLYPSFYEGFGLPVLEAMQCGACVLASEDPAIAEVSGGSAVLLNSQNEAKWVAAMTAVLDHPENFAGLREQAVRRAAQFSWKRTAQLTREVYEEAKRRFGR